PMKSIFKATFIACLLAATLASCKKEASPVIDVPHAVTPQASQEWLDSSFVAYTPITEDYASVILSEVNVWESPLTTDQFNMIYSMYTGELHPIDFYWLSVNGHRDSPTIEGLGTNT